MANLRAFSLLELIIVVAIVAVVAAIAIPRFSSANENATKHATIASLTIIQSQVDIYHARYDEYPLTIDPTWFRGDVIPANPYAKDSSARAIKTVDRDKSHPLNKLLPRPAAWWYNLRRGIVRARISDLDDDVLSLQLYNDINQSGVTDLAQTSE